MIYNFQRLINLLKLLHIEWDYQNPVKHKLQNHLIFKPLQGIV